MDFVERHYANALVAIAGMGLLIGTIFWWVSAAYYADIAWSMATAPVLLGLFAQIFTSLRKGDVGLDVVAALSMSAALAFGEPLAGNVVAMMYAGGQLLEAYAQGRARREMTALMGRVAHTAMRYGDSGLEEVSIGSVRPADRLLIRQGEVLPVDGRVASRTAEESTYSGIVRLVEAAQASKAPMVCIADRYAIGFLLLTLAIASITWFLTQDTIRVLSVLVVATPCPLILAVPVALMAGMSRTAGMGVLVKGGAMLEALAKVRTVILDKTGTLTHGQAEVSEIIVAGTTSETELLRSAASLDQASGHVVASALIRAAEARGLALSPPHDVTELPGTGIEGIVDGKRVVVGGSSFVRQRSDGCDPHTLLARTGPATMTVAVADDGTLSGLIVLADRLRSDAAALLTDLRGAGVVRIVLASGDRLEIAAAVGKTLGVDLVLGDLSPDAKVEAIRAERVGGPVMMVGDGVNDAPALAAADIGVAMGARGTASSSEAAGVVLLVDELAPLVKAMAVARRSRSIALQSVFAGLGLSLAAMAAAAFGHLPPVQGALLQEVIDVAVILNALRALR